MEKGYSSSPSWIWGLLCWIAVIAGMMLGIRWYWHLPTVGYAGLMLAMGATLMPLFWEKVGVVARMAWIAMLFLLLAVEYRAIDQDKNNSSKELGGYFQGLSSQANANLQQILTDEHKSFEHVMSNQQLAFAETLKTIVQSQQASQREFNRLLIKQEELFAAQNEFSEALAGRLVPGDSPTPPNACTRMGETIQDDEVQIVFGDNVTVVRNFPHIILGLRPGGAASYIPALSVDKIAGSGTLALDVESRTTDGRISFRMDKNGTVVRDSSLISLHPDKSTFLLQDDFGREVLRAQYVNRQTLIVNGGVSFCGQIIPLQLPAHRGCFVNRGIPAATPAPDVGYQVGCIKQP